MDNYADFFADLGNLLLFTNTVIYFIRYKTNSIAYKILCFYLLYVLIIQLYSGYLSDNKKGNLFLSHYYFIGQFILMSSFYYKILKGRLKSMIPYISCFILIILSYHFFNNPQLYNQFFLLEVVICSLPLVLFSIFYFFQSFGIENKKFLIINSGVFIYLLSSTLIFSSGNLMKDISDLFTSRIVWVMNAILYVLYQFLILGEWFKNFRKHLQKPTP